MRTLLLVDEKAKDKISRINAAMDKISTDYGGDVTWEVQYRNFDNLKWIYYDSKAKGIDFNYINVTNKEIYEKNNLAYDNVVYCVDPLNWQDGEVAVGGWNLGGKFNNLYPQIVKVMQSDEWLYKAFAMEIIHMWDDACSAELLINLNNIAGMDWDYDVIHGENPKWGKYVKGTPQETWTKTDYYTDYNFTPVIKEFGAYLKLALDKRKRTYDAFINNLKLQISLLERIISLWQQIRALKRPTPTAITIGELAGEGGHNHSHSH